MPKWRPGVDAGRRLFRTGTRRDYEAALLLHPHVCEEVARRDRAARAGKSVKKSAGKYRWGDIDLVRKQLPSNDIWMQKELPALLSERGRMDKEDMRRLLAWKWAYGKYRPGKTRFEDANRDESVAVATAEAVSLMNDGLETVGSDTDTDVLITAAVSALTTMPQVGPATATAVLSAGYPSLCPYYADEAMETTGMFREPYTLKRYLEFAQILRAKAETLGGDLNANSISRALWAVCKANALGMDVASSSVAEPASSTNTSSSLVTRPSKRRKTAAGKK